MVFGVVPTSLTINIFSVGWNRHPTLWSAEAWKHGQTIVPGTSLWGRALRYVSWQRKCQNRLQIFPRIRAWIKFVRLNTIIQRAIQRAKNSTMSCSLVFTLAVFLAVGYFVCVATGSQAKILLESRLEGPIRVIAAVGNARVGKSTTLNLISHIWDGKNENSAVEEIFQTGDSYN